MLNAQTKAAAKTPRLFCSRFAEVERNSDGTYTVVNVVTGATAECGTDLADANGRAHICHARYAGIERDAGW